MEGDTDKRRPVCNFLSSSSSCTASNYYMAAPTRYQRFLSYSTFISFFVAIYCNQTLSIDISIRHYKKNRTTRLMQFIKVYAWYRCVFIFPILQHQEREKDSDGRNKTRKTDSWMLYNPFPVVGKSRTNLTASFSS